MFVGVRNFSSGETLKERVDENDVRWLRNIAGFDPSLGPALPDKLPTRVSTTQLAGAMPQQVPIAFRDDTGVRILCRDYNGAVRIMGTDGVWDSSPIRYPFGQWKHCSFSGGTDLIACVGHGYSDTNPVIFGTTGGGVTAGTLYYVRDSVADAFRVALAAGGAAVDLSTMADQDVVLRTELSGSVLTSPPFRLGPLVVFPTKGADAKLVAVEPDSPTTKARPFSLKSPRDYDATSVPTVTPSTHPARQIFNLVSGGAGWVEPGGKTGVETAGPYDDYQGLGFYYGCPASQVSFTYDLGTAGAPIGDVKYVCLDLILKYLGTDPIGVIVKAGEFVNSDQTVLASGFDFILFSDQACTTEVRRYPIPQLTSTGAVNRVIFHIGTLSTIKTCTMAATGDLVTCTAHGYNVNDPISFGSSTGGVTTSTVYYVKTAPSADTFTFSTSAGGATFNITADGSNTVAATIRGLGIGTSSYFVGPVGASDEYVVWVYSYALDSDWEHKGNFALPAVSHTESPWVEDLPPDPGTIGTSAVVMETFPESFDNFTPDHPLAQYVYCYRGRDALSTTRYHVMISDPSEEATAVFSDPWRTYLITVPSELDSNNNSVDLEYGDYFTHYLIYRATYDGLGEDELTGELGIWSDYEFIQALAHPTMTYTDAGVDADPEVDDHDVPEYLELNHAKADSAQYAVPADGRVYMLCLTYDNANSHWDRPLQMAVTNFEDFGSSPTTPTDEDMATDGQELGEFSPHSATGRGLLVKNDTKYVYTDNGYWELVGQDSEGGWRFLRRDSIGLGSVRTLADCRSFIGWHPGGVNDFHASIGGASEPISDGQIDPSLFDWTAAHGFVFWADRYVGFAYYNDAAQSTPWCLFVYDPERRSWRRRHSTSYELAGICVADASGTVYGLTHDGDIVSVFGGTADYGGPAATYLIDTQYLKMAGQGHERHTRHLVLEAVTDQASIDLTISVYSQGRLNDSDAGRTLSIGSTRTKYGAGDFNLDLTGDAVRVVLSYTGAYPPDIYALGVDVDPEAMEI